MQFNKDTKLTMRPLKSGASKVPKDEYILFTAEIRNRPAGSRLEWEVKNWGVDGDNHHAERYGKNERSGSYDLSMGREDGELEWTRKTAYTGRHECIVRLVDPILRRVVTAERFVVQVGGPRPRYQRRMGRKRR